VRSVAFSSRPLDSITKAMLKSRFAVAGPGVLGPWIAAMSATVVIVEEVIT